MARNEESTTKFKVDISDFKKSMQEASRLTKLAQSEFNAATAGMGKWSESVDGVSAKLKQLGTVLTAQKRQLAVLESEYAKVVEEQGAESKGATELMIKINNQTAAVKKTESEMNHYSEVLDNLQKETLELGDDTVEAGKDAKKGAEGFTVMKGALADLVATGIKQAIKGLKELGKEAVQAYKEFDAGRDKVIKATGATGEAADELIKSYKNVAETVRGDFSALGSTLGEINTRMGLTGKALENATVDFTKFAEVTGTDATEAVRLVTRAMNNAGLDLKDYNDVLDQLAIASQASGISVDTLAESLTKFGAPMRSLGLDTKDSIALFASWEKAGVNTTTAFQGLRRAVGNWSKEGKNAKKEFAKVIKDIKSAPNATKAAEKAIEAFGSKAGPELAEAIQGGRFEYEKFVDLLQGSEGTVRKTYEQTQDGFDKIDLALQKGRTRLASALDVVIKKYSPEITRFIDGAVVKIGELFEALGKGFKFVMDNKDGILSALAGIATAFVTYKTVTTVSAVVGAFQSLFTAIKAGEGAMAALSASISASPVGLAAAAIAGLTAAMVAYNESQKEAVRAQYNLNSEQQQSIENSKALAAEYEEIDKRRAESNEAIASEYGYLKDLKEEYNSLVDSNGKIKEGYESRADFILNQLAQAMGVERKEIDKTIKKNGKLGKSIDDLMIKQQGKALLDSNQQFYNEAIAGRTEALETYQDALTTTKQREEELAKAMKEAGMSAEQWKEYQDALASNDITKVLAYQKGAGLENLEAIQRAEESYNSAAEGLKNAENAYVDMSQTIQNYEGLSVAILEGDADKIKASMESLTNNFVTADAGNERVLREQLDRFRVHYDKLQKAVADGIAGISDEDLKKSQDLVQKAGKEVLDYFKKTDIYTKAKEAGIKIPESITEGITSGRLTIEDAMQGLENLLNYENGYDGTGIAAIAKNLGVSIPENVAQGIISGQMDIRDADKIIYDTITSALETTAADAGIKAEDIPENIRLAVLEGDMGIGEAVEKLKATVDSKLTDTTAKQKGTEMTGNYAAGITAGQAGAVLAAQQVAQNAASELNVDTETSGDNFVAGFVNGINKNLQKASTAGAAVAVEAIEALKKAQEEGSPSKITTQSGVYFTEGFILGMKSLSKKVGETAADIAKTAVQNLKAGKTIDFTADFNRQAELVMLQLEHSTEKQLKVYNRNIDKLTKQRDKATGEDRKKYTKLLKAEQKARDDFQKASSIMLSDFSNAISGYATSAEELINATIDGVTERYDEKVKNLTDKQTNLAEKMREASELFEISSAGVLKINDLTEQTKQIEEYAGNLMTIKSKVSNELFEQLTSYDMKEGSAFISQLLKMSEEELQAYDQAFVNKVAATENLSAKIYESNFKQIDKTYQTEMKQALAGLPALLEELGKETMQAFVKGLTEDTQYLGKAAKAIVKQVKDNFKLQDSEGAVFKQLSERFKNVTNDVMKSLSMKVDLGEVPKVYTPTTATTTGGTVVNNNYNLVQNNNSPKSLSALETYNARRQQLAMLKALQ